MSFISSKTRRGGRVRGDASLSSLSQGGSNMKKASFHPSIVGMDEENQEKPPQDCPERGNSGNLDYRSRLDDRRRCDGWRANVLALLGFVLAGTAGGALDYGSAAGALRGGLSPPATACWTLLVGITPLVCFGFTGVGLHNRTAAGAMIPAALVGWGIAGLLEGVFFATMTG